MRIGIVLADTPGYSETFFHSKIKGLKDNGHDVIIYASRKDPKFTVCPVKLSLILPKSLLKRFFVVFSRVLILFLSQPKTIFRFIAAERKDKRLAKEIIENIFINSHILTQTLDWLHFGFATMTIRRENVAIAIESKMGVSLRGYDISLYPLKNPECYKLLWKKSDKIHVISHALTIKAQQYGLTDIQKVMKITPAIDINKFQNTRDVIKSEKKINLLTIARLKWVKGIEYTLHAIKLLKTSGITFHYTIIGDGDEYRRLVFAAFQLGLNDCITFTGKQSHEHVKEAMENADIYLQYSIQEGFCNSVLEAQAMGLLCLVSDAEGLPENVLHEKTGWVVPKRNPELLAKKILEVIKLSEDDKNTIRNNAIKRVQKEFNIEKQQSEFAAFFKNQN